MLGEVSSMGRLLSDLSKGEISLWCVPLGCTSLGLGLTLGLTERILLDLLILVQSNNLSGSLVDWSYELLVNEILWL
jgi:hypothetical protein